MATGVVGVAEWAAVVAIDEVYRDAVIADLRVIRGAQRLWRVAGYGVVGPKTRRLEHRG
ncbi:Uncharacterised protein [Mycobacterium tuberculosis]|nr:Uncharacterised protein [Mycobacterium tuberculosis]CKT45365.1 Uncharacterised protein [Mycobacterium tuberculosis]CPC07595.1 Uncharacterised protein [Mycobacterium tuberculosis]